MCSTGRTDIDNDARLLVLYAEIRRSGADEFEWCCVVDGDHGIPLFIGDLLPLTLCIIPCKPSRLEENGKDRQTL